jgi:hypothetical protein
MAFVIVASCLVGVATASTAYAEARRRTATVKHAPIVSPGDVSESWSPQQNIIASKQYEQLLRTNPAFRKARMQKECGGITDAELRQSCLASFDRYKS